MTTDEIAEEAAEEIREYYNLSGYAVILPIIKSAIDKAFQLEARESEKIPTP